MSVNGSAVLPRPSNLPVAKFHLPTIGAGTTFRNRLAVFLRGSAKDFQEAFRIRADYFQSQLKAGADDATQFGAKMVGSFN
jgi:hypothetical protein